MTALSILDIIIILLAISVFVSVLCRKLQLPVILGYLIIGIVVGPFALGWIPNIEKIQDAAEFGVVFLMFTVGLEFSLSKLITLRQTVFVLGLLQVLLTILITTLAGLLFGMPLMTSLIVGGITAMSSTAIVTKLLSDRLEIAAQHGTNAVGILLFQDLAVIPLLILIASFSPSSHQNASAIVLDLLWALAKGGVAVLVITAIGRWLLRPLFHLIASTHIIELFTLTVLLVTMGAAWLTQKLGLSLALGAFLAGIMLGETEFRHQIEVEIRPFRDVLLGLFFISIGMLLNISTWHQTWQWILLLVVALTVGKALIITFLSRTFGFDKLTSVRTGVVLGQGGEFGFALLTLAIANDVLPNDYGQVVLGALLISITIAPILIHYNKEIAQLLFPQMAKYNLFETKQTVSYHIEKLRRPVIICGYGRVGQNVARILEKADIDYMALDNDPVIIRNANLSGDSVLFGDATHPAILKAAKLNRAGAIVISFSQIHAVTKILELVRRTNKKIPIIVRCRDESHFEELQKHGATEVIAETFEESLILAFNTLTRMDISHSRAARIVQNIRSHHYDLLRQVFPGTNASESEHNATPQAQLKPLIIAEEAFANGRTISELNLEKIKVVVVAVSIGSQPHVKATPSLIVHSGDVLVLYGTPENLERAESIIQSG